MVGEMKKIFCLLCILFSIGVSDAATMCVPDLSTCNSCVSVTFSGTQWVADCCGVSVSGIGFFIADNYYSYTQSVPQTINIAVSNPANYLGYAYVACLMTSPVVPKFYHVPFLVQYGSEAFDDVGEVCSYNFNPKCAISGCDLSPHTLSSGVDPA